ncbi:DUF1816 domain-containing protein [Microcoleus sp. LEGE 07076]|uniref:DUF1816 domain-containing protein n=1 Tax=Microcoleus sp. LEGE 07076 TaxID=915322 RepID=UPI00403F97C3
MSLPRVNNKSAGVACGIVKTPLNKLEKQMKEFLISLLNVFGLAWWVEVKTSTPRCIYYFGPFMTASEAESAKAGYVEDIESEGAQGINVLIQRCKPIDLTVAEDLGKIGDGGLWPVLSGQS